MLKVALLTVFTVSLLSAGEKLMQVKLEKEGRFSLPVKIDLPQGFVVSTPLKVICPSRPQLKIVSQYDAQEKCLWFIPSPELQQYEVHTAAGDNQEESFRTVQTSDSIEVKYKDSEILKYHHAHEPVGDHKISPGFLKKAGPEWYVRSAFIHPVYTPAGKLVTDNFPLDHPHHKGIWFAWTHTVIDGRDVDFWNLGSKQGTVQFDGYEAVSTGAVFSQFKVKHNWINYLAEPTDRVALKENWNIKTFALSKGDQKAWMLDFESVQKPLVDIHFPEYRYGGFAYRGSKEWVGDKHIVLTSEGKSKKDAHLSRGRWIAYSGKVDGKYATVALFSHPRNFRFPEPFRVWPDKGAFLNIAPSQQGDWDMKKGETYKWKYSLVIYDGEIDADWINEVWEGWAKPVGVLK